MGREKESVECVERNILLLVYTQMHPAKCTVYTGWSDARGEDLRFEILRHTKKGYTATRKQKGWTKSKVFDRAFQLVREPDELGNPDFTLSFQ